MSMKTDLSKMDFLSLFSHEIKTPLSAFQLGLSLLEKDFEKNKDIIPLLKSELIFLNQFISNILDLRWIEKKKENFSFEWVSFHSLLESAYTGLKIMAKNKGLSLNIKNKEMIDVFVDPLWMNCVLKNLLSNAIRFSPKNKPIELETHYDYRSSQFVCSIVNFSPLKLETEKLFDLFYTRSQDSEDKGTGLGLNLVQSIIKAHGGKIQAKNQGKQVVFSFFLPKSKAPSIKKIA